MLCPNAADWGNVADWIAGVGTMLAVIAALGIALFDHRRAERQRTLDRNEEARRMADVRAEAIRLAGEVEIAAGNFAQLVEFGGGRNISGHIHIRDQVNGIRSQLAALQQFPISEPKLFALLGRLIAECEVEVGVDQSTSAAQLQLRALVKTIANRRAELAALK